MTTPPTGDLLTGTGDYKSKFRAKFGIDAGTDGPYEYDGIIAMVKAIAAAGSTDSAKVVNALHEQVHFTGLTGNVVFDSKGDRPAFAYVAVRVENAIYTVVARVTNNKWAAVSG